MAKNIVKDKTVLAGNGSLALDLSGFGNDLKFDDPFDEKGTTSWSDTVHRRIAILGDASFSMAVQLETASDPRATLQGILGDAAGILTYIDSNASMAEGDRCYSVKALASELGIPIEHGEITEATLTGKGDGPVVDGQVLQEDGSLTVTGTSVGIQLGSVAAGESAYADMHVLTATAGTLDMIVESDDNSGFTSATTRLTFAQVATTPSSFRQTVAGAITDDWWRASYTIATGPYVAVVTLGIK